MSPVPDRVVQAFGAHERETGIHRARVACLLVIVLMPAGAILDAAVYPAHFLAFLVLRLVSSLVAACLYVALAKERFARAHAVLATGWYLVPTVAIAAMIGLTEGFESPYYAGLNLVSLCAAVVLQVTVKQSIGVIVAILVCYLTASGASAALDADVPSWSAIINNLYFLVLTGVVVLTGSVIVSRMRLREFALRYELDEKGKELEDSNRQLKELDEAKSRFFANISHELRTPLTLLLAPLESELQRSNAGHDEETRNALSVMRDNGLRLLRLINDLLDLVKLDSKGMKLTPRRIDLPRFLSGIMSSISIAARERRVELMKDFDEAPAQFVVDQEKLEKILLNLLFNALKFNRPGGSVRLTCRSEGRDLLIAVADTGIGIGEEDLPNLFHRFWQADDSSRRKYQGTGIGLSLVSDLVKLHSGEISVQSAVGEGTTFVVRLPALPEAETEQLEEGREAETETEGEVEEDLSQKARYFGGLESIEQQRSADDLAGVASNRGAASAATVLVADDEEDMLEFLYVQLRDRYEVLRASDGVEALEKCKTVLPDAILLDGMMPEMDGFEVCRQLRANTPTKSTPIVMLTARADEATKFKALECGATDFLTKPFSITEVKSRLRNLVEASKFQKELALKNTLLQSALENLKETKEQLAQSEKLASLGKMSAGIVHEINNPLNIVNTFFYALRKMESKIPPDSRERFNTVCDTIESNHRRIERIVSDLRTFAHEDPGRSIKSRFLTRRPPLSGSAVRSLKVSR